MLPRFLFGILLCFLFLASTARAQDRVGGARKQATALSVGGDVIRLDGRLDDQPWRRATAITEFLQKEPIEGATPTEQMDVRFAYDATGLYVGARMYSRDPRMIQAPLGRRDEVATQSENIIVSLDTFLDRRTAYSFGVSASGVRLDRFHPQDDETRFDAGFDPVWEVQTNIDEQGWTAEFWIPFSQLRFNEQATQTWGLNIRRFTPTLQEEDYWVLVPRTERAWASRFGELRGIESIRRTRRVELLPFIVGSTTRDSQREAANPFDTAHNLAGRVGLDMKMGLGPSLTLQATVNPDFGQVEADPAEVNLSVIPTRFVEKRPFFTEDAQLLATFGQTSYYSRRIGARPLIQASADFVDYPEATTILGAAKLTGRIRPRTSLGILAAVTDDEAARLATRGSPLITKTRVTAPAAYGLARVQREFGQLGSTASVMVIGMRRALGAADPLAALLSRSTFSGSADTVLRFKGGEYEFRMGAGGQIVNGEPSAIERLQRSSVHFAQRPDKQYAQLDPTLTSLRGFWARPSLQRVSGRHWIWSASTAFQSPSLELNDTGFISGADGIQPTVRLSYRETTPGRFLRNYSIEIADRGEWNFGGDRQRNTIQPSVNVTWKNFWTTRVSVGFNQRTKNATLTRGGPLMEEPTRWSSTATVNNGTTAQTGWSGTATIARDEDGGWSRRFNGSFSFRPSPQWQLAVTPLYDRLVYTQQYVTTLGAGRPATYDKRYVFAEIERSTLSTQFRMGYTLKPDLNLDVYAEPFAASGRYYNYGELLRPSTRERLAYGASGTSVTPQSDGSLIVSADGNPFAVDNHDFNVRSFRNTTVLRYEWRLGSTLYLVWQQNRHAENSMGTRVGLGDMFSSLTDQGTNVFLVKTSFWLPVR